jgi:hypothetical protein
VSADAKPAEVEFEIPVMTDLAENLAPYWAFGVCFVLWVESESRFARTSKQVIAHRLIAALEGDAKVARWRESDWRFVCELLEDTEVELVPTLSARSPDSEAPPQPVPPPAFLTRRYLGAILGAKPVGVDGAVAEPAPPA